MATTIQIPDDKAFHNLMFSSKTIKTLAIGPPIIQLPNAAIVDIITSVGLISLKK